MKFYLSYNFTYQHKEFKMKQLVLLVATVAVLMGKDIKSPSIELTREGCNLAYKNLCKFYENKKNKDKAFREEFMKRKKFYNTHCIVRAK